MTHRECRLLWPQFLAESFSYRTHNLRASTVQCPYIVYSTRSERLGAARSGAADSRSMNPARHRIVSHCNEQSCVWCLLCYVLGFCLPHVLCVSFVADSHWSATFSRWTISCLQLQYSASQMHSLISRFAFKFVLSSRVESSRVCALAREWKFNKGPRPTNRLCRRSLFSQLNEVNSIAITCLLGLIHLCAH